MQTKLTLRLESGLIELAKRHAEKKGRSLSRMVADYFQSFKTQGTEVGRPLTPLVASMRGILKGAKMDGKKDWHGHWENKYR